MCGRKLLLLSYAFSPSIGGIERSSQILAQTFSRRGYDVTVITNTPGHGDEPGVPYRVVRRPAIKTLVSGIRGADFVLQNNISLSLAWPLWVLFLRKPFVLLHNTPMARPDGRLAWQDRLKRVLLWRPRCLSVSRYLAETIRPGSAVIPNPYDSEVFRVIAGMQRTRDLLFVGRLVSAKGTDTLLRAFAIVLGLRPGTSLSIVGLGPEEGKLRELANSLGVTQHVDFLGARRGREVAETMNQHRILVVPSRSRPPEALPVVVLEGIACGCVPVASRMGGLPECVGNAGMLFEEGNHEELAEILVRLLSSPDLIENYRARAERHLDQFRPDTVADAFESYFAVS
jgi:glycosyltransferase involved in cell wall biosynthesis